MLPTFKHFGTDAIHAGQPSDPRTGAVMVPISLATTFHQESPGITHAGFEYARTNNPTRQAYEQCVAKLENAQYGIAFSSGMAATSALIHLMLPHDEIIVIDDMYGGTNRYLNRIAAPFAQLKITLSPLNDLEALKKQVSDITKIVWIETPTNPTLKVTDIAAVSKIVHEVNPKTIVIVDSTFMSSYLQRPLDLGADVVMHSVSKYMNGHSDVIGGVVATSSNEINSRLRFIQNGMGAIPSPFDCYMVMRGLKTLHVRMRQHNENAMAVANLLAKHDKVEKVIYPGLPEHPQHELAKKQQTGFGGMITFYVKGGLAGAKAFLENVKVFALAESLGGVESLCEHPAIMTHASVPPDQRAALGISDAMIRLSVGIEDAEDILADLENALSFVHA